LFFKRLEAARVEIERDEKARSKIAPELRAGIV
jgi:hypothetical protein